MLKNALNPADVSLVLSEVSLRGHVEARWMESVRIGLSRAGKYQGSTYGQDNWGKLLAAMARAGTLTRTVERGSPSRTSGQWLAPVRLVPRRVATYRLAERV